MFISQVYLQIVLLSLKSLRSAQAMMEGSCHVGSSASSKAASSQLHCGSDDIVFKKLTIESDGSVSGIEYNDQKIENIPSQELLAKKAKAKNILKELDSLHKDAGGFPQEHIDRHDLKQTYHSKSITDCFEKLQLIQENLAIKTFKEIMELGVKKSSIYLPEIEGNSIGRTLENCQVSTKTFSTSDMLQILNDLLHKKDPQAIGLYNESEKTSILAMPYMKLQDLIFKTLRCMEKRNDITKEDLIDLFSDEKILASSIITPLSANHFRKFMEDSGDLTLQEVFSQVDYLSIMNGILDKQQEERALYYLLCSQSISYTREVSSFFEEEGAKNKDQTQLGQGLFDQRNLEDEFKHFARKNFLLGTFLQLIEKTKPCIEKLIRSQKYAGVIKDAKSSQKNPIKEVLSCLSMEPYLITKLKGCKSSGFFPSNDSRLISSIQSTIEESTRIHSQAQKDTGNNKFNEFNHFKRNFHVSFMKWINESYGTV